MALSRELARCVTGVEEASLSKSARENRLVASPLVQLGEGWPGSAQSFQVPRPSFELRGPATRQAATAGRRIRHSKPRIRIHAAISITYEDGTAASARCRRGEP